MWAPVGERPTALGHHRFEWLYVTAFVAPESGETVWYLSDGIDKRLFEMMLAGFARETGAGRDRIIVLLLDGAGWHTEPNLAVPDGIRLVYLPPYTPELQPAEHLWPLVDEPVANRHFATLADLDAVLAEPLPHTPPRPRPHRRQHPVPLVAEDREPELINRIRYDLKLRACGPEHEPRRRRPRFVVQILVTPPAGTLRTRRKS